MQIDWSIVLPIALTIVVIVIGGYARKLFKELKELIDAIVDAMVDSEITAEELAKIIKEAKRITQKEIRKQTSLSESKISLIISQLESENKIKKIKKGRTNIIIAK